MSVSKSHNCMMGLLNPPLASIFPSVEKASALTCPVCPVNSAVSFPSGTSYTHTPTSVPTARRVPSGEKRIRLIPPFPSHAIAPSGNPTFVLSCAKLFKSSPIVNSEVRQNSHFIFMISLLCFPLPIWRRFCPNPIGVPCHPDYRSQEFSHRVKTPTFLFLPYVQTVFPGQCQYPRPITG